MENTIKLCSPNKLWRAEISARFGANVTKLEFDGKDVLRPLQTPENLNISKYVYGAPILFPANRTEDGRFTFENENYELPINEPKTNCNLHGVLVVSEFLVDAVSDTSVTLSFENRGEVYPFPFKFTANYTITDNGLIKQYTVLNTGNKNMPFTFALHTTFVEPDIFSVPISAAQERNERNLPTGKLLPLNDAEKRFVSGFKSFGNTISGYYKSCGNTAKIGDFKYVTSDNFDYWVLFNNCGTAGYLCVEPQCGSVNGLNFKDGHKVILPGSSEFFVAKILKNG